MTLWRAAGGGGPHEAGAGVFSLYRRVAGRPAWLVCSRALRSEAVRTLAPAPRAGAALPCTPQLRTLNPPTAA